MTYPKNAHWSFLNLMSSIGAWLMGVAILVFLWNVFVSLRRGAPAGDDPWEANTLEWYTTSPPPEHNFTSLPPIRSDRPLFDLRHPEVREP